MSETISIYMEQDHDLIDGIAERAVAAAAAGDWATLEREGSEFLRRLRRHIEMEEDLLFPAFEQRTGMAAGGPSVQMREEHVQMQPILAQLQSAVSGQDGPGYERATQALLEILVPHNQKEEQMMYPMLDEAMGADRQALLADVKQMAL
ncbi:hemerythrin domain-containing protein [Ramlibacter sp.]|uniref:hemerythrin domain-containing protein n=1 Tax=Ramlibacter sp. TaxID=1917967 RepID=UPI002D24B10E|nr:hemerythrin domain-containing protein [Ramlibacter sp.]HYD75833.1 hemerythrin domain-containing protein [Ramlibacter sp.]